jgi:hypothetical protein
MCFSAYPHEDCKLWLIACFVEDHQIEFQGLAPVQIVSRRVCVKEPQVLSLIARVLTGGRSSPRGSVGYTSVPLIYSLLTPGRRRQRPVNLAYSLMVHCAQTPF